MSTAKVINILGERLRISKIKQYSIYSGTFYFRNELPETKNFNYNGIPIEEIMNTAKDSAGFNIFKRLKLHFHTVIIKNSMRVPEEQLWSTIDLEYSILKCMTVQNTTSIQI